MIEIRFTTAAIRVFILLTLLIFPMQDSAQYSEVKRIDAETSDRLLISIWIEQQTLNIGGAITIHYKVGNRGPKTIYLVRDNTSEIVIDRGTILLQEPFVPVGGHEPYDYSFTRIEPGRIHTGQLVIPGDKLKEAQPWRIEVGFGYVKDIRGLNRKLSASEDPAPLKSLLSSRIKTLLLGSLVVEVSDK